MEETIFGINPVLEMLKSQPERVHQLFLPHGTLKGKKKLIFSLARQHNIKIHLIPRSRFNQIAGNEAHQGVVGIILPYSYQPLEALLENWKRSREKALFLILDGITDPQNFGAIARSACTVGAHGIIISKHRSAPINKVAVKASAGAFSYIPVCRVTNLVSVIETLKKEGIWIIGTSEEAKLSLYAQDFNSDLVIIIGSEGKGLSSLVKKHCDFLFSIPTQGEISSLNAAVATGVVLYEVWRQRHYN